MNLFEDRELVDEFVVESQEGLADVENQMLSIEAQGVNVEEDLVNSVFRTMHSIKGAAGFLGLDRIGQLAHGLEEVLDYLRNRKVVPTSELVTAVLTAADFMQGLIDEIETSNDADVAPFIEQLRQFHPDAVSAAPKPVATSVSAAPPEEPTMTTPPVATAESAVVETPVPATPAATPAAESSTPPTPSESPASGIVSASELDETIRDFIIECTENLEQMDADIVALEQDPSSAPLIRSVFRTIHTVKGGAGFLGFKRLESLTHAAESLLCRVRANEVDVDQQVVDALLATVDSCRTAFQLVNTQGNDAQFDPAAALALLKELEAAKPTGPAPASAPTPAPTARVAPPAPVALAAPPVESPSANSANDSDDRASRKSAESADKGHAASDSTIRVDVGLLDKLMNRVGELVLARNQILQHISHQEDSSFASTAQRLNLITTELQEDVMKTRMQPIGNIWAKFPRVVRDLSSQLGKQVGIEMEGKETELDKTIVEAIKDPLTHLVRNSVDHGIEPPDKRVAAGKPAEGRLLLRAYHEGGQVIIEVADDGAGLNFDRIRAKAVERGLINADDAAQMSDREASQLIMAPGFSTAQQVTSVSGRGVGMDVVKTNIERIGGTIDVDSRPGLGTTINIKIPLTLAIIPALVVTDGGDRYAIPQVSLLELVRLEGEQVGGIEYIHGAPVYRLRGRLLPLISLSEQLGLEPSEADDTSLEDRVVNIVVLRANDRQFGLIVDRVNDTEEIVVKPLSRQLKSISEFAGATIMGDGTVALILDVGGLATTSGLAAEKARELESSDANADSTSSGTTERLLIVDLGDSRRFALPTSMVSRLEKIPRDSIEQAHGGEVVQYRGAIMPLWRLTDVFGGPAMLEEADEVQIIVFADESNEDRTCGLVVNRIVDIVETELRIHVDSNNDLLFGTTIIQDRVTDVINLKNVAQRQLARL
ncbi:MAG: chemotaxis protein CheA [Planctomycetales bacterium]|nr:chemotaxis protein CheA [Planctomycetales bacterium]